MNPLPPPPPRTHPMLQLPYFKPNPMGVVHTIVAYLGVLIPPSPALQIIPQSRSSKCQKQSIEGLGVLMTYNKFSFDFWLSSSSECWEKRRREGHLVSRMNCYWPDVKHSYKSPPKSLNVKPFFPFFIRLPLFLV